MTIRPGSPARGSDTGRPIMVLLDALGRRWALRIIWELSAENLTFRDLQARCGDISPTVLNSRLKELRGLRILTKSDEGYMLTDQGRALCEHLGPLDAWAKTWADTLK